MQTRCRGREVGKKASRLTTETVQRTALPLQCIDNIERSHSLALGVLSVCDCIANHTLQESLEDSTRLFVDHCERTRQMRLIVRVADGDAYWQRYA